MAGVAMFALLSLTASACTVYAGNNGQYTVTTGVGIYANIQEIPTWQIVQLSYVNHCGGNVNCTATDLLTVVHLKGWGATQFHTALTSPTNLNQLNNQLYGLASLGSHNDGYGTEAAKCLVLYDSIFNEVDWQSANYNLNNGCGDGSAATFQ